MPGRPHIGRNILNGPIGAPPFGDAPGVDDDPSFAILIFLLGLLYFICKGAIRCVRWICERGSRLLSRADTRSVHAGAGDEPVSGVPNKRTPLLPKTVCQGQELEKADCNLPGRLIQAEVKHLSG